jgi:ABC-type transport system substrate-binding protein
LHRLDRRSLLAGGAALGWPLADAAPSRSSGAAFTPGVLRAAFETAEAGFDPPRVSDSPSVVTNSHLFESPLTYDPLASPARLVPQTAAALPEVSADFRHIVVTLKPGILFAPDPVFQGRARELVAADYVYSIKRYYDPAVRSEHLYLYEAAGPLGLAELRQRALKDKTPFDYDAPVPGLRVLDRYRFELRLTRPSPRFVYTLASPGVCPAVAREVVEHYGAEIMAHPVGTGPFMLASWRRSSQIVLVRNPNFREQRYAAEPPADDPALVALAARLRGRRLPLLERIEIDIIEEAQPRWLAFLRGDLDQLTVPSQMGALALPGGRLAPFLARQGVAARRVLMPSLSHTFFNFDDPVVGGYEPAQVALRRAIAMAWDNELENRLVTSGHDLPAQGLIGPGLVGHEPGLRSEMGVGDVVRARALLDLHGYRDRDGDGWREQPDGRPLLLRIAFGPDQRQRLRAELWEKRLRAVGLRLKIEIAPFAELIRRSLAGQLMMWGFIWFTDSPDGGFFLSLGYGPAADQNNDARFRLPAFDRLFEQQRELPDGPERLALMARLQRLMLAYAPYVAHSHVSRTELTWPQVRGLVRHPYARDWWRAVEVN